ncbi:hypothetical protein, partial [Agrobacterium larrymoorei]|uniref:hypothetical protein n=1 Tax=Agrobacterium larrymoorei TaxID=160699 RepID=UPI001AED4DD1
MSAVRIRRIPHISGDFQGFFAPIRWTERCDVAIPSFAAEASAPTFHEGVAASFCIPCMIMEADAV